jgi:hypothetical protein
MTPEDKTKLQASLDQLYGILKEIAVVADQVSRRRCPYKDRHDRCTAHFGCRNQLRTGVPGEPPICTGDDKLDYRSAWESS